MPLYPMGFHITWGTKGTRLHGSRKPHVDRDHNDYHAPLAPTDPEREQESRDRMKGDPVYLTLEQRKVVEEAASREGEELRDALKAVASRALNKRFGKQDWWAEKGSARYLWERDYFANARDYVRDQRDY